MSFAVSNPATVSIKVFGMEVDPVQETPVYSLPPEVTAMLKRLGDKRFAGSMCRAAARSSRAIPPRRYREGSAREGDRDEQTRMAKPCNVRHWAKIIERRYDRWLASTGATRGVPVTLPGKIEYLTIEGTINV